MAKFDKRYGEKDRRAMYLLADLGLNPRQIAETLQRDGYPPLELMPATQPIPLSSVRKIVQQERTKAAPETLSPLAARAPDEAITELRARLITVAERETDKLIKAQANGTLDYAALDRMASVLTRLHQTTKGSDPNRAAGARPDAPDHGGGSPETFASRLAAKGAPTPPTSAPHSVSRETPRPEPSQAQPTSALSSRETEHHDGQPPALNGSDQGQSYSPPTPTPPAQGA